MAETPTIASSYTFDPFARHQFYHDVNESLVRRAIDRLDAALPKGRAAHVVELASGTGAVTELILDEMERLGRPGSVTGIEPSTEAVEIARERLAGRQVEFIQGDFREEEVLAALVDGEPALAIADRATVSEATVRSHIRSVLTKLGVGSQLQAVAKARRAGWSREGRSRR